jgi:NAD-dependent SIR2 family protein deacetylase
VNWRLTILFYYVLTSYFFSSSNTGLYNSEFVKDLKLASPQDVFSLPLFIQDPRPFYRLAEKVFLPVIEGDTKPTAAHWFIKLLHSKGILLRNYTQNIDGLERKAGIPPEFLVESHGTFSTASCPSCHMPVPEGER